MTTVPDAIPFSSIIFGLRERTVYPDIEELADSILQLGMLCPLILSPLTDGSYRLEDGGRRYRALELLGVETVYHARTGEHNYPGFVLKSEVATDSSAWLTELVANLHREALDWRDELRLIVKAYRGVKRQNDIAGQKTYYEVVGKMLGGYNYSDVNAAVCVHDQVQADPEFFADCTSLHSAYNKSLKRSRDAIEKVMADRSKAAAAQHKQEAAAKVIETLDGILEQPIPTSEIIIPFFSRFHQGDSYALMESLPAESFNHIITDPDFALEQEMLEAGCAIAGDGIAHESVEHSLADLNRLMPLALRLLKPGGFFIFFYDLMHHEKLHAMVESAGFVKQRWPLIWHKTDYTGNTAPQYNTCKNIEYAMVCRRPGATLSKVQMSSVISVPGRNAKDFGHPFAKPIALWHRLFDMCCAPGQSVFDPFMGRGSCPFSAVTFGLEPHGCELSEAHFNGAVVNIQGAYKTKLGSHVVFQ